MIKINNNFNLYNTITCGQIFRYEINNNKYLLYLEDRVVLIEEYNNYLVITSSNEDNLLNVINYYLGLNTDYDKINNNLLLMDKSLNNIIKLSIGFRIMNTPKLETIISYIASSNNTVKNIANSINLLSIKYGTPCYFQDKTYYLFPKLDKLKELSINDYIECKLGFRSKYIYDFIQNISYEDINKIDNMETNDALDYLMSYKGIGLKIASCILLFAYNKFDVFPIDTWVKKYMKDNYNLDDMKKIKEYSKEHYKEYSGIVIQYLFNINRNKS